VDDGENAGAWTEGKQTRLRIRAESPRFFLTSARRIFNNNARVSLRCYAALAARALKINLKTLIIMI